MFFQDHRLVGSVFGVAEVGVAASACCQLCPHTHTHTNTLAHTHHVHTDVQRFSAFQYFHFACSGWLKIFSVKNVEKSKTTKTEGNNNNSSKNKKKNMVRPRRPPVFHNFSFLFIYTIRYIFVFMCRSPTDLRFASATIGHRDSSILVAASAACRHIFFLFTLFRTFSWLFPRWFSRIFTKFSTQFGRVLSQQTKQITI